jgi:hypothetical protein
MFLLFSSTAHAYETSARYELSANLSVERDAGAEQCAESADLQRRVDAILRRPAGASERSEELAIDVRFARTADGAFVAHVAATGSKPGQRWLRDSSPSCDALSEAVSVAIALLLDTRAGDATEASSSSEQREQRASPIIQSPPEPAKSAAQAPAPTTDFSRWHGQALLGAGVGYGLGGAGTGLGLGQLGARGEHWLLELGIAGTLPDSTEFGAGRVRTSLLLGSARACYSVGSAFAIGPCAELGVGRLRGEGRGFGQAQTSSLPWIAAGLGLAAQTPLGSRLFAAFGATLWVPTRRQTFSVQNSGIAWESKPLAGVVSAGLGARLF